MSHDIRVKKSFSEFIKACEVNIIECPTEHNVLEHLFRIECMDEARWMSTFFCVGTKNSYWSYYFDCAL